MERLTERFENGQAAVLGCGNNCKYDYKYCNNYLEDCPTIGEIYEKLAAYEDAEEQGRILPAPLDGVERFSLDNGKTTWQRVYEADMPEGGTTVNENEAIEVLKDFNKQVTAKADGAYQSTIGKMACDTAIKALEEVQQYRAIGKISTCQNAVEICKAMIERGIEPDNIVEYIKCEDDMIQRGYDLKRLLEMMEEHKQYRAIGTPEELRSLKEHGAFTGTELAQLAAMQMRLREYEQIGTPEECRTAMTVKKEVQEIVDRQLVAGKNNYKETYDCFWEIVKVVQANY